MSEIKGNRLQFFPIPFYAIVLGLSGFTIAFQRAETILKFPVKVSPALFIITLLVFLFITVMYTAKMIKYPGEVKKDFAHPNKINFFAAFSISLLLISVAFQAYSGGAAKWIALAGMVLHFLFTIKVLSFWIQHGKLEIVSMNPAWFIPIVGNLIMPVAAAPYFSMEISWFFFSVGIVFWVILFSILFNRIIFHRPMHEKMLPTLFILIAPPAVAVLAYSKLIDGFNDFNRIMYYFALFLLITLIAQIKYLYRSKFFLSWWAYSFPISAITLATIIMFHETGFAFFNVLGYILLTLLCFVIIGLTIKTIQSAAKGEICVSEE